MGFARFDRELAPTPYSYDAIVYTVRPFPFRLSGGTTAVTACSSALAWRAQHPRDGVGVSPTEVWSWQDVWSPRNLLLP